MLIILLILFVFIKSEQICEGFLIHQNFDDCYIAIRRGIEVPPTLICPNLGTWGCSSFICEFQSSPGTCGYGNTNHQLEPHACCTQKDIRYLDFWFTPQEDELADWYIKVYDYDVYGEGANITVENQVFQNMYDFIGQETFISITLGGYNEETCTTNFTLYINGSRAIIHNTNILNIYSGIEAKNIFKIKFRENVQNPQSAQTISFFSAHTVIPTDEQIMELYLLGNNRSVDTEICYDLPCTGGSGVSSGYKTATIVLSIILGVIFLCNILLFVLSIFRYFTSNKGESYSEMKEF